MDQKKFNIIIVTSIISLAAVGLYLNKQGQYTFPTNSYTSNTSQSQSPSETLDVIEPTPNQIPEEVVPTPDQSPDTSPVISPSPNGDTTSFSNCLPSDIKPADIVSASITGFTNGVQVGLKQITVEQKLNELKAKCNSNNELIDSNLTPIAFYKLKSCWGVLPPNYEEILQKEKDDIDKLEKNYTVIEMTCNPSGIPLR